VPRLERNQGGCFLHAVSGEDEFAAHLLNR